MDDDTIEPVSRERAVLAVVAGMVLTFPAQLYLGAIGKTGLFADADAGYVLNTALWAGAVIVTLLVGLALALVLCGYLMRELDERVRRPVQLRFLVWLLAIVVASGLALIGGISVSGRIPHLDAITPFMLAVWIGGPLLAGRSMRRAPGFPRSRQARAAG